MDNTALIVFVCVGIFTNLLTTFSQTALVFMKLIKKSTCCGGSLEMKASSEKINISPVEHLKDFTKDKTFDMIIERLEKSGSIDHHPKK